MSLDGEDLKGMYEKHTTNRSPYLMRARECALYTIPTLIPPEGATGSYKFPTPYQSLGARGVNNLAAKLMLSLFPANSPFFRLALDDFMLKKLTGQDGLRGMVEEALSSMERAVMTNIETTNTRVASFEALKLLIASGNVVVHMLPKGGMKLFRLDRFVVKRDPSGGVLDIITKEMLSPMELPEELALIIGAEQAAKGERKPNAEDLHELYTRITRTPTGWRVSQEVAGHHVPGSDGTYPKDKCPWLALRFIAVDGEDYGRSFVEEYLGDLKSLEGLTGAIVKGAAAAAKVLFLVRPNATTKQKTLAEAPSGAIREGNKDDVSVVQMDKYADFRVALDTINTLTERLSYAFLLNTAVQRKGERVTAEEIRYMAGELESALGGVYSTLSQEFQLPVVICVMHRMERQGKLPPLPKGAVTPQITTGIEALGRGNDLTKLSGLLQDLQVLGPETIAQYLDVGDFIKRAAAARGIDQKGLVRTAEQIAQANQQSQMMQMIEKLGPNAVNQVGGMARDNAAAAAEQQPTQ